MLKPFLLTAGLLLSAPLFAAGNPHVLLTTNLGEIELELDAEKAPISVENFLTYVDKGLYDGTIFHRVIKDFMIQGGGFNKSFQKVPGYASIKNEADNGLNNQRGTLAMARTMDPNSATSQFFINLKDNDFLNHGQRDFGYAVFGKVVRGMEVVDKIGAQPTYNRGIMQDIPREDMVIESAKRL